MRIGILHNTFTEGGGAEQVVLQQAAELTRQGHDVTCFVASGSDSFYFEGQLANVKSEKYLNFVRFPLFRQAIDLVFTSAFALFAARKLKNFDLLIAHQQPGPWIAYLANKRYGVPYVNYIHHPLRFLYPRNGQKQSDWVDSGEKRLISMVRFAGNLVRKIDRISIRGANLSFVNSSATQSEVQDVYKIPSKVCYPPLSREIVEFDPQVAIESNSLLSSLPKSYVLVVARHTPRKKIDWAIQVFEQLTESHPDLNLVVVGQSRPGYTESLTENLLEATASKIQMLERVPSEDLLQIFSRASALIHLTPREEFGMVLAEATALGTPVIGWDDQSGPSEIVDPGTNGLLAKPYDLSDFCRQTRLALDDPELKRGTVQSSAAARRKLSIESHVHSLLGELEPQGSNVFAKAGDIEKDLGVLVMKDSGAQQPATDPVLYGAIVSFVDDPHSNAPTFIELLNSTHERLIALAKPNGMTGLIAHLVSSLPLQIRNTIDPTVQIQLQHELDEIERYHVQADSLVLPALEQLDKQGIKYSILKGFDLARRVYPERSMRPMNDVDVLVDKSDIHQTANTFIKNGFSVPGKTVEQLLAYDHEISLVQDDIDLDLHWDLHEPLSIHRFPVKTLIEQSEERNTPSGHYVAFQDRDLIQHVAFHLEHHLMSNYLGCPDDPLNQQIFKVPERKSVNTIKIMWAYDMALLIRNSADLLRDGTLVNDSIHNGFHDGFLCVLNVTRKLFPKTLGASLQDVEDVLLNAQPHAQSSPRKSPSKRMTQTEIPLVQVKLIRIVQVWRFLWPTGDEMRYLYGDKGRFKLFNRFHRLATASFTIAKMTSALVSDNIQHAWRSRTNRAG